MVLDIQGNALLFNDFLGATMGLAGLLVPQHVLDRK
jgi:hypothetical protein